MFTQIRGIKKEKLTKIMLFFYLFLLIGGIFIPCVVAQGEEQVVNDFADFMINILNGPVSKVMAAFILLTGVVSLLKGRQDIAVGCALAFAILIFLPTLIQSFVR